MTRSFSSADSTVGSGGSAVEEPAQGDDSPRLDILCTRPAVASDSQWTIVMCQSRCVVEPFTRRYRQSQVRVMRSLGRPSTGSDMMQRKGTDGPEDLRWRRASTLRRVALVVVVMFFVQLGPLSHHLCLLLTSRIPSFSVVY